MWGLLSSRTCRGYSTTARFHARLQQITERTEVEIEVALFQSEVLRQLAHAAVELHEGLPQALDLLVAEVAGVHTAQRLSLHQLAQELDQREHELRETLLDLLRVGLDAARERLWKVLELAGDAAEVAVRIEQLRAELAVVAHEAPVAKL